MREVKLSEEDAQALRMALGVLVIRTRTGELGIMHGADRFVSTNRSLRKADREALDAAARKVGLGRIQEDGG